MSGGCPVLAAGFAGCGGQDEAGGCSGDGEVQVEQDAGVGVGGEHDAGVAELFLDGFEVGAGGVGEVGCAVTEVVQTYGRETGADHEPVEAAGQVVPVESLPVRRSGGEVEGVELHHRASTAQELEMVKPQFLSAVCCFAAHPGQHLFVWRTARRPGGHLVSV